MTDADEELAHALCEADNNRSATRAGIGVTWDSLSPVWRDSYVRMAAAARVHLEGEQVALVQELASVTRHRDILLSVTTDPLLMDQVYQSLQDEREGRQPVPFRDIQRLVAVERERDALLGLLRRSYLHGAEGAVSVDHCDVPLCHEIAAALAAALAAPSGDAPPAEMPRSGPET